MLNYEIVTPPAAEPVTLSEVKTFCRVDAGITGQDDLLNSLITTARAWVENWCGISCIYTGYQMKLGGFPPAFGLGNFGNQVFRTGPALAVGAGAWPSSPGTVDNSIRFPVGPVVSLAAGGDWLFDYPRVRYYDTAGGLQTLTAGTDFEADFAGVPARLQLLPGKSWPATQGGRALPVVVDFVAGFGANAAAVPAPIKTAIRLLVASWERNREADFFVGESLTYALNSLLGPYRRRGYF